MTSVNNESKLNIRDLLKKGENLTFLVGAGCSIDPPSCLPASNEMIKNIIKYSCAASEIEKILKLKNLRLETILDIIRDCLDEELKIIDYYGLCDKPNIQHYFIADMIKKGAFVLTTNFDFLIEYALLQSNVMKKRIATVITEKDFKKFSDPIKLLKSGRLSLYKIHSSAKNIIFDEETRDSLSDTIKLLGFNKIQKTYSDCEKILSGITPEKIKEDKEKEPVSVNLLFFIFLLIIAIIILLFAYKKKQN